MKLFLLCACLVCGVACFCFGQSAEDQALQDLFDAAGVHPEHGIGNAGGRDFDSKSMSASDLNKIKNAAVSKGYQVETRSDSFTIRGKDGKPLREFTGHYQDSFKDPAGSSAADARNISGDPESFKGRPDPETGVVARDAKGNIKNPTVNDVLGKGSGTSHPLTSDPKNMSSDQLKDLGKMVNKVMKAGNVSNPTLQQQAKLLHETGDPAAAGISDINEFQQQGRDAATEAVRNENKVIQQERVQLENQVRQAEQTLNEAKARGNPQEIAKAKTNYETVKGRAISYNSQVSGTTTKAVQNGAGEIYAKANGYEPVPQSDGTTSFRDTKTGRLVSRSGMTETIAKANTANVRPATPSTGKSTTGITEPTEPVPGAKPMGPVMKGVGGGLLLAAIIDGGIKAYNKVKSEANPGDNPIWTFGKFLGYTTLNATGVQHAWDTGREAGDMAVDQYNQDVKDGKISGTGVSGSLWYGFYKFGGAVNGSLEFLTEVFVDPLIAGGTAVKEGVGAVQDSREASKKDAEAKAAENKVAEAKNAKPQNKNGTGKGPQGGIDITVPGTDIDKIDFNAGNKTEPASDTPAPETKPPTTGDKKVGLKNNKGPDKKSEKKESDDDKKQSEEKKPDNPAPVVNNTPPEPGTVTTDDPVLPPGHTKVFKGFVENKTGKTELYEIKDPKGNVVNVIHVNLDPNGNILSTQEYPANQAVEASELAGAWKGSMVFNRVDMPDSITAANPASSDGKEVKMTRQQCEEKLEIGKPRPMNLEIKPASATSGVLVSRDEKDGSVKETPYTIQGDEMKIAASDQGATSHITLKIARNGNQLTLAGPLSIDVAPQGKTLARIEGEIHLAK